MVHFITHLSCSFFSHGRYRWSKQPRIPPLLLKTPRKEVKRMVLKPKLLFQPIRESKSNLLNHPRLNKLLLRFELISKIAYCIDFFTFFFQKKSSENINSRLQLVVKSGKFSLGYKSTMDQLKRGKAKLVLLSNNIPVVKKSEIEYYAMLSKTLVHHYPGNNLELGTACGQYYGVGAMTVTEPGDSDIIKSLKA